MSILTWFLRFRSNFSGVYRIRNKVTDCEYIGGTTRPIKVRWAQHIAGLKCNRHKNRRLQQDWNKYGAGAFEFSVIEVVRGHDRIFKRERYWQDRNYDRKRRYNPKNEDAQRTYFAQGKHSRHNNPRVETIAFLAVKKDGDGKYVYSANKIAELVGGTRADVLKLIGEIRGTRKEQPRTTGTTYRPEQGW